MILRYFYDETLAHASYLVGCSATGEALVIDPMRDITPYLERAAQAGLRITHVTETHIHADFVSGTCELINATGAQCFLSDTADTSYHSMYVDQPNVMLVRDGDTWMVGNVKVEVLATPGHTPEHIAFRITDTAASNLPIGIFTGDFLFAGDVGRPDLLEAAAGMVGTKEVGARQQYGSVQRFKAMSDYLQIWPGHGAGSACGKALGAIPSTTLGYEKLVNPAFQFTDEDLFCAWLLDGQPEPPRYFGRMKYINQVGPPIIAQLPVPRLLEPHELDAILSDQGLVIDIRPKEAYTANHVPGTLSIPATSLQFNTYAGWFVDYTKPTFLILEQADDLEHTLTQLRAIGIDDIPGYFLANTILAGRSQALTTIQADQLAEALRSRAVQVLDVRGKSEYDQLHIEDAIHIPLGYISSNIALLDPDSPIITQCASGYRAHIAASVLRRAGFTQVRVLADPTGSWRQLVPVVTQQAESVAA